MSTARTAIPRTPAGLAPVASDFDVEKEEQGIFARRDTSRHVTPAVIDFYKNRAHQLRA
jgi:hypothetical protein